MPRILHASGLILGVGFSTAGCWFDAHYTSGQVTCDDGVCPSNLVCKNTVCVTPMVDANVVHDAALDAAPDSQTQLAALTCADPGSFIADTTVTGTTTGRTNTIQSTCAASVMFGADAVYKVSGTLGHTITLTPHSADYPVVAYLISPCAMSTACVGNKYATDTVPTTLTFPATTDYYVIVDGPNAALTGAYSLTVTMQ